VSLKVTMAAAHGAVGPVSVNEADTVELALDVSNA